jgi:hypothetical protein
MVNEGEQQDLTVVDELKAHDCVPQGESAVNDVQRCGLPVMKLIGSGLSGRWVTFDESQVGVGTITLRRPGQQEITLFGASEYFVQQNRGETRNRGGRKMSVKPKPSEIRISGCSAKPGGEHTTWVFGFEDGQTEELQAWVETLNTQVFPPKPGVSFADPPPAPPLLRVTSLHKMVRDQLAESKLHTCPPSVACEKEMRRPGRTGLSWKKKVLQVYPGFIRYSDSAEPEASVLGDGKALLCPYAMKYNTLTHLSPSPQPPSPLIATGKFLYFGRPSLTSLIRLP